MSIYTDASLIVTPNAVKAGKLYNLKPTDGAGDLDVVRATSATRVNENGLIETVGNNIARLDYSNGSCPSILVEPQRTNLLLRSEQIENSYWTKIGSSITFDNTISPAGSLNANLLTGDGTNTSPRFFSPSLTLTAAPYVISVFAKKGTNDFISLQFLFFTSGTGVSVNAFDLNNGTTNAVGAKIENYGNGWYKCTSAPFTPNVTDLNGFIMLTLSKALNVISFSTNEEANGKSAYFWGVQLEQGSNDTSYIPTVESTATRNADVISKSGLTGITTITETFEDDTTNVISGSPTSYTMSQGRIKNVIGI